MAKARVAKRFSSRKKSSSTSGKHSRGSKGARPSWSGILRFGLVTFSVRAFNALSKEGDRPDMDLLHKKCHSHIHYEKHCPIHGKVDNDEIVTAYEYQKGKYVEFTPEELDELRTPANQTLTIDTFVATDQVDPIYFDGRMYFLRPTRDSDEDPFLLFQKALKATDRFGIGQAVLFGKEQIILIRPYQETLLMLILNYAEEIRNEAELPKVPSRVKLSAKQLQLAEKLIEASSEDEFDLTAYRNDYRERFEKLVERKIQGRKIVESDEEKAEEEAEVINLMDALQKSLKTVKTPRKGMKSAARVTKSRKGKPRRAS